MDSAKGAIKKRRSKDFQISWLDEDIFKRWFAPHSVKDKALCTACNTIIRCCKTELVRYSQTVKHIGNINSNVNCNATDKYEITSFYYRGLRLSPPTLTPPTSGAHDSPLRFSPPPLPLLQGCPTLTFDSHLRSLGVMTLTTYVKVKVIGGGAPLINIFTNLENIYVGPECKNFLKILSFEYAQQIQLNYLNFYITALEEMLKRLPYKDPFFQTLTFLCTIDPKIGLYEEGRLKIKDIDIIWKQITEFKNFNGVKMFPNLESLVEVVFSLPHSNVEAERIFSIVTDVKNKKRNRLSNDTVSAICVVRSNFQDKNINCTNFEIDSRHLELHNAQNLYKDQSKSDDA
ncbi:hypothetical protein ALC57_16443 [Trachymyrmex cornetzi]|uniref:HAT C-terminal dimerisation domain-containing protein n=1 Tax=Trachymyrmex cornetzi TaxID=471704 RepID=A0A151IV71_9HYME|nr:hypothetical protein ALC57_16443 [Trachymyrmex cornetzi]